MAGAMAAGGAAASSAKRDGPANAAAESPSSGCSGRASPLAMAARLASASGPLKSAWPPIRSRYLAQQQQV